MEATHITIEGKTRRQVVNAAMKAMAALTGLDCGTASNPFELPSIILRDGRTIIGTIREDGYLRYNDGYIIVEVDDYFLYVDYTSRAVNEWNLGKYGINDNTNL